MDLDLALDYILPLDLDLAPDYILPLDLDLAPYYILPLDLDQAPDYILALVSVLFPFLTLGLGLVSTRASNFLGSPHLLLALVCGGLSLPLLNDFPVLSFVSVGPGAACRSWLARTQF